MMWGPCRAVVSLCVVLWSYPLGPFGEVGKAGQQELRLEVCEARGQQFLHAKRVMSFTDGSLIQEITEVVIPWGSEHAPTPAPVRQ